MSLSLSIIFSRSRSLNSLNVAPQNPRPEVNAEPVLWTIVKLFGNPHDSGLRQRCAKLVHCIAVWQPELRQMCEARKAALDQAVQGLGMHGLTADHTNALNSLHVTMKNELQRHIDTYKLAGQRLLELSPITVNQDPAHSSHQRLLAIGYNHIQQRLIDNKTLLTILERPSLKTLGELIENLSQRVQNDKEVLFCVGQIKRIDSQASTESRPAAGLLMNFSRGCDAVLALMGPPVALAAAESPTMLAAPNSPSTNSCDSSDGYHSDSEQFPGTLSDSDMVKMYRGLYIKHRMATMEALELLVPLKRTNHLKAKILFSIIVVSMLIRFTRID